MFCHLHTRSWFSFLAGGSSPRTLVQRAADLGMNALALTDLNGVYGTVRFQKACRTAGIHAVVGAEIITKDGPLLLLARSPEGYRNLCLLLTESHLQNRKDPVSELDSLRRHREDLICLTGGRESRLWQLVSKGTFTAAGTWLETLPQILRNPFRIGFLTLTGVHLTLYLSRSSFSTLKWRIILNKWSLHTLLYYLGNS